jgi:two-component system sensor histidine kinase AlgZ
LVENAVYHGIARLPQGGTIRVAVGLEGSEVRVTVDNPVPPQGRQSEGNRMALSNIGQRLQAIYGTHARLEVTPGSGRYRVELGYQPGFAL